MSIADQLEQLEQLRDKGALSDTEFQAAKNRLLGNEPQPPFKSSGSMVFGIEDRTYCTLMHVSQLLNYSVVGVVVPIVMWILAKDTSEMVSRHGNRMMNWIISSFVYYVIAAILTFVLIGIPMLFAIAIAGLVLPIIAAIKANSGEVWSYPLCIRFLPED